MNRYHKDVYFSQEHAEQSAWAEYNETCVLAFSKIVKKAKYRKDTWK